MLQKTLRIPKGRNQHHQWEKKNNNITVFLRIFQNWFFQIIVKNMERKRTLETGT